MKPHIFRRGGAWWVQTLIAGRPWVFVNDSWDQCVARAIREKS